jgi:hypothetical protein
MCGSSFAFQLVSVQGGIWFQSVSLVSVSWSSSFHESVIISFRSSSSFVFVVFVSTGVSGRRVTVSSFEFSHSVCVQLVFRGQVRFGRRWL